MDRRILTLISAGLLMLGALAGTASADSVYHNPAVPGPGNALYWLDQGGLLATYGNYPAATKAYAKAIELDPGQSEAYYNLGVALAEMQKLTEGLSQIEKAISLDPRNGRFYYARGRIHLFTGDRDNALSDFNRAAALGNIDAIDFLNR